MHDNKNKRSSCHRQLPRIKWWACRAPLALLWSLSCGAGAGPSSSTHHRGRNGLFESLHSSVCANCTADVVVDVDVDVSDSSAPPLRTAADSGEPSERAGPDQRQPPAGDGRFRVYAFAPGYATDNYVKYDWSRITTLCLFGLEFGTMLGGDDVEEETGRGGVLRNVDPVWAGAQRQHVRDVVATAHAHGVAVDVAVTYPASELFDENRRSRFLRDVVRIVQTYDLDGVNLDAEDPIDASDDAARYALASLVWDIRSALVNNVIDRHTYLSVDVAWSSSGIDGRNYNYTALADAADVLFVMVGKQWGGRYDRG